jgi:Cu2+-exporting ATPase
MSAVPATASCFHCGLPVPAGALRHVLIDGAAQPMCCPGCEAVAQAIVDIGQTEYYRTRSDYAATRLGAAPLPAALALYDQDNRDFVQQRGASCEATLSVEGIRCAACVWLIEKQLNRLPGVQAASLNVATERLYVRWDGAQCQPSAIFAAINQVGYSAYPFDAQRHGEQLARSAKALSRQLFVAGLAMMQVMMYAVPAYLADDGTLEAPMAALMQWASLLLTLPVMAYSALPFYRAAWSGLKARAPGMDVPVVLGIGAAFVASVVATLRGQGEVYFDSVTMFVFLLLCSRYLELGARRKAATALERILGALPQAALRMAGYPADRATETVAAASLQKGDIILVKAGDAFAADGIIADGDTSIDLSLLSGESAPQRRASGDSVPGGAVNIGAPVALRVAKAMRDSTLSELIRLTQRAGASKPRLDTWADLVASRFVVLLLVFAACVFGAWQWIDPGRAWPIAIAVLVVSCPCALSLAMPTVMAAATDKLLRRGVLVVQAHTLETLHRATHIVFDKTGTLTLGRPQLQAMHNTGALGDAACLAIAAAIEAGSGHPLAQAINAAAGPQPLPVAVQVLEAPGRGMQAQVNGLTYRIGNAAYVGELTGCPPWLDQAAAGFDAGDAGLADAGVFLGRAGQLLAVMRFTDGVRSDAAATVLAFQRAGKDVILLSGDHDAAAQGVGAALGIATVRGGYLPQQKLDFVKRLQQQGAVVAMVGDGINDAAVLSAADVSFAMGSGAALAQVNADCVLLSGRIGSLAETAQVAAGAMRIVRQNLAWATVYNLLAIPAAALGLITPWMSGLGMTASSALVVLNALRARH